MSLDTIIPPEVYQDEFSSWISQLAAEESVSKVLEIGSSDGAGSTSSLVAGLNPKSGRVLLFCLEVSRRRFEALQQRYAQQRYVICLNGSSVTSGEFPTEEQVTEFYQTTPTNLNRYPLFTVLGWLEQDREYLRNSGLAQGLIDQIKLDWDIAQFDLVLIDGSEFLGEAELKHVLGAKYVLLDDVNAFKNYRNRQSLLHDAAYRLKHENLQCRNGFSIFERVSEPPK